MRSRAYSQELRKRQPFVYRWAGYLWLIYEPSGGRAPRIQENRMRAPPRPTGIGRNREESMRGDTRWRWLGIVPPVATDTVVVKLWNFSPTALKYPHRLSRCRPLSKAGYAELVMPAPSDDVGRRHECCSLVHCRRRCRRRPDAAPASTTEFQRSTRWLWQRVN